MNYTNSHRNVSDVLRPNLSAHWAGSHSPYPAKVRKRHDPPQSHARAGTSSGPMAAFRYCAVKPESDPEGWPQLGRDIARKSAKGLARVRVSVIQGVHARLEEI